MQKPLFNKVIHNPKKVKEVINIYADNRFLSSG